MRGARRKFEGGALFVPLALTSLLPNHFQKSKYTMKAYSHAEKTCIRPFDNTLTHTQKKKTFSDKMLRVNDKSKNSLSIHFEFEGAY